VGYSHDRAKILGHSEHGGKKHRSGRIKTHLCVQFGRTMPTKISHFRLTEEDKAHIKNICDGHKLITGIDAVRLALKIYSEAVEKARVKKQEQLQEL
jgi:hypothetical protein